MIGSAGGKLGVMSSERSHEPALAEDALTESLKKVAVTLKGADVAFALAGSFAAYARGGPLPVHDVDFFLLPQDIEKAEVALTDAGLRIEHPPLDWLFKAYDGDCLVDLIHHPLGRPVHPEVLDRADQLEVLAVRMPVLSATDLVVFKLLTFREHECDFGAALPIARALREQIDWQIVRKETDQSPYARAFLGLLEDLGIIDREAPGGGA
jgi:putative nucleotidyltransferase-like protein